MRFTTRPFLKYLFPLIAICGVGLLISIFWDFGLKDENQQNAALWLTIAVVFFFFVIPYFSLKHFKVIEYENGLWSVEFPYLKKKIELTTENIQKIELMENIRSRYVTSHSQLNIRIIGESSIIISSLEIKEFSELVRLLSKDFKGLIKKSDFWKG